jgi:dipeptidase D
MEEKEMKKLLLVALILSMLFAFAIPATAADASSPGSVNPPIVVMSVGGGGGSGGGTGLLADYVVSLAPSRTSLEIGATLWVDVILQGAANYAQIAAEIAYDAALLEFTGYENLQGWAAGVTKPAAHKVAVRSVPGMNMVVGAPCLDGVSIVTLMFTAKGGFAGDNAAAGLSFDSLLVSPPAGVTGTSVAPGEAVNITINDYSALQKEAYKYFCQLLQIPHASGDEQAISDYLVEFANAHGLEVIQDEVLNVLIKKPGSLGREAEQPVILQGHMDMVYTKNDDSDHRYAIDPIIPYLDGDWIKSGVGTSLGADNGGGLSIIMAILAADNLSHPPLEAIITVEEETSWIGVDNFDTSLLKGKRFINMDGDETTLIVSSAGSAYAFIDIPFEYKSIPPDLATYKLSVKGLKGGHSGVDIEKGRANANILMAQLLKALADEAIYLADIDGGEARNAIPRLCTATIAFAESDLHKVESIVAQMEAVFINANPVDEGLVLTLEKTEAATKVIGKDTLLTLIECILKTPNGVQKMDPNIEGFVQTSNNLGLIYIYTDDDFGDTLELANMIRSSLEEDLDMMVEKMNLLGEIPGVIVFAGLSSLPWEYKEDSPLRDTMVSVYKNMYGKAPIVAGVHAGLECAVFALNMPDGDFISMGPEIVDGHSPDERMSLASFNRTCVYLVRILENL